MKVKKETIKLTDDEKRRIERSASRQADLDLGIKPYGTKIHKNKKKEIHRKRKHKHKEA
jgi:hypothetical protein